MVSCVGIGTFTGAIFLIVLLFVAGDMDTITTSAAGPLLQIFMDATKNTAGAICLLMFVPNSVLIGSAFADTNQGCPSCA